MRDLMANAFQLEGGGYALVPESVRVVVVHPTPHVSGGSVSDEVKRLRALADSLEQWDQRVDKGYGR